MEGSSTGGLPPPSALADFPPLPASSLTKTSQVQTSSLHNELNHSSSNSNVSLWSDLFNRKSNSQKTFPPPVINENGTPVVKAPASILLKSAEAWRDYIICRFFGEPPPMKKIFSDLNKIWGKGGNIQIRHFNSSTCLILIPDVSIRTWALEVGFWSSGTVAFSTAPWSPSASFAEHPLTSVPMWLTFHHVPPLLWSTEGFALIASGVGTPILPANQESAAPVNRGAPRMRAVVSLDKGPLPETVIVEDSEGNQFNIGISYPPLPPRCPTCKRFGHGAHRCPLRSRIPSSSLQFLKPKDSSSTLPSGHPPALASASAPALPSSSLLPALDIPASTLHSPAIDHSSVQAASNESVQSKGFNSPSARVALVSDGSPAQRFAPQSGPSKPIFSSQQVASSLTAHSGPAHIAGSDKSSSPAHFSIPPGPIASSSPSSPSRLHRTSSPPAPSPTVPVLPPPSSAVSPTSVSAADIEAFSLPSPAIHALSCPPSSPLVKRNPLSSTKQPSSSSPGSLIFRSSSSSTVCPTPPHKLPFSPPSPETFTSLLLQVQENNSEAPPANYRPKLPIILNFPLFNLQYLT